MVSRCKPAQDRDRGSVTVFVVGLVLSFTVAAGLAFDSGRLVAARITIADHAENAARLGAQQVGNIRGGGRVLRPSAARSAALSYLSLNGLRGDVEVGSRTVTVTTRLTQSTMFLRLVGIGRRTVSATRSAEIRSS